MLPALALHHEHILPVRVGRRAPLERGVCDVDVNIHRKPQRADPGTDDVKELHPARGSVVEDHGAIQQAALQQLQCDWPALPEARGCLEGLGVLDEEGVLACEQLLVLRGLAHVGHGEAASDGRAVGC